MSAKSTLAKQRKVGSKANSTVSDAKLRSLVELNDAVERAHNSNDLLRRLIADTTGTDLRALVAKVKEHLCGIAQECILKQQRAADANEQQQRLMLAFAQKQLSEDDVQSLHHLFDKLCGLTVNANDDKARIAQLATVFSILTVDIDVRRTLVLPSKQTERFPDQIATATTDAVADDRRYASVIDKSALTMYLEHDARHLMSAYRDGVISAIEYVDRSVAAYLSYLPSITPRIARSFYAIVDQHE